MNKNIDICNHEIYSQKESQNALEKVKNFYKNIMQDLLKEINMKITNMKATLIQLNDYQIHNESINIISKEKHFYEYIAEQLESNIAK